jgi:NADPH:quinone reductase-like Zn-dependent oxidoreductase
MSLLTAWQFLIDLGHEAPNPFQSFTHQPVPLAGKTVVVNGAGGGVGHFAVQLAKWQGARVIAVASGRHEALMRDLGVDQFIDYNQTAAENVVRDADLVIDAVGNLDRPLPAQHQAGRRAVPRQPAWFHQPCRG